VIGTELNIDLEECILRPVISYIALYSYCRSIPYSGFSLQANMLSVAAQWQRFGLT